MRAMVRRAPSIGRVSAIALRGHLRVKYPDGIDPALVDAPNGEPFIRVVEIQVVP